MRGGFFGARVVRVFGGVRVSHTCKVVVVIPSMEKGVGEKGLAGWVRRLVVGLS